MQGGVITPANHNVIFLITGKRGMEFGYHDRFHSDGQVEYFGEGQIGDMQMKGGNRAIVTHAANGKSLLLFEKSYPARELTLYDEMVCEGWHREPSQDRDGNERSAIVFELRPLSLITDQANEIAPARADLAQLRIKAMEAAAPSVSTGTATRNIYQRSADVRDYVLARSNGFCEGCENAAPFARRNGVPYLEPHHIRRASDGGPDDPRFVIALCPNCHRQVHFGMDGDTYNDALLAKVTSLEN